MLNSLKTGIDVSDNDSHMRKIWFNGDASHMFPHIFNPTETETANTYIMEISSAQAVNQLLERFKQQKLHVYRKVLARTNSFCVTKCIASQIATTDSLYYSQSHRLQSFAEYMGTTFAPSKYSGTLFM